MSGSTPWTDDELNTLEAFYGTMSTSQLAKKIGRPYYGVMAQAQTLGLMKRRTDGPKRIEKPAPGVTVHRCL